MAGRPVLRGCGRSSLFAQQAALVSAPCGLRPIRAAPRRPISGGYITLAAEGAVTEADEVVA